MPTIINVVIINPQKEGARIMPKQITMIHVFVSSPSDVVEERACLEDVIRELNKLWKDSKNIRLELIRWETDTYPDMGEDGQNVISHQVQGEYDIFIGVLWKKFGTPTSCAGSGTEEEFLEAYKLFREEPENLRIMFYFKESKIDQKGLDLDQLIQIRDFKKKIEKLGSYHWSFKDRDEFARLMRLHLTRQIERWGKSWGRPDAVKSEPTAMTISTPDKKKVDQEPDEEGFLDLVETAIDSFALLTTSLENIGSETTTLSKNMEIRTEELTLDSQDNKPHDLKKIKRSMNQAALDLERYSARIETEAPLFKVNLSQALNAYANAASLFPEFSPTEQESDELLDDAVITISDIKKNLNESIPKVEEFRNVIAGMPRITTRYNRVRRRTVGILDEFIADLKSANDQIYEVERVFDLLMKKEVELSEDQLFILAIFTESGDESVNALFASYQKEFPGETLTEVKHITHSLEKHGLISCIGNIGGNLSYTATNEGIKRMRKEKEIIKIYRNTIDNHKEMSIKASQF